MKLFEKVGHALGKTVMPIKPATPIKLLVPMFELTGIRSVSAERFKNAEVFRVQSAIFQNPTVSPNLLFSIPETDFKAGFQLLSSEVFGLEEIPLPETRISDNLLGLLEQLEFSTQISNNLFTPLSCSGLDGKRYSEQRAKEQQQDSLFSDFSPAPEKDDFKKAYTRTRTPNSISTHAVQKLTLWDLIYPILLPPLNLDFTPQLDLPHPLRDYQMPGITFLVDHESALLADEMGTGKTVMSTVALRLLFKTGKVNKALIICPVNLLKVWQDHLLDWASELEFTVVRGTREVRELDWKYPAHVYLTNYEIVASDFLRDSLVKPETLSSFDVVIIDEAQHIKNRTSDKSRAVKMVRPKYRWAITGTPLENRLDDLVSIFEFVKPNHLRSEGLTPSLATKLIEPYFLRRLKKDVLKDLPPKIKQETWLELEPSQRAEYEAAKQAGTGKLENLGKQVTKVHIFALINELKQICNFARNGASSKTKALLERVEEIRDSGQKVIVFTQYRKYGVYKLEDKLKSFGVTVMHGDMPLPLRQESIRNFKNDPNITVFLSTLKTGGEGLTLTEASYVIHFDHWWNPAKMWQAEDRVHRHGQKEKRGVNVYSFWMQNTIEERIYQKLYKKGLLFEEVVNGLSEDAIEQMISTEEWLEMLGVDTSKMSAKTTQQPPQPKKPQTITEVYNLLATLDPLKFEEITKTVFAKIGFINVRTTKRSHDGGIDILGYKRSIGGVGSKKVIAQCKRMPKVGVEVARELLGVLAADQQIAEGFIVTSGAVSSECRAFSERDGRLSIIEGPLLANYIIQFGIPIS
jgi:superfamily II DNA or RNA helicase